MQKYSEFIMLLLWFLISRNSLTAQGNWEQILPYGPTTNQIVSLSFANDQTGWAVGEYGTILKTNNGGMDWRVIEIPWLHFLLDVFFPTEQVGYAVGQEGQIIKTTDGGETWLRQIVSYSNNLHRVRFRDENEGWIVGEKGLLLHTTNGGATWLQKTSHTREDLNGITFIEHSGMCVVGNGGTILLSENGGQSWQPVTFEPRPVWGNNPAFNLKDVFFLNADYGWIAGTVFRKENIDYPQGIILDTVSGGKTWRDQAHYYNGRPDISSGFQQIYFTDIQHGLCLVDKTLHYWVPGNIPYYSESTGRYWVSGIEESEGISGEESSVTGRFAFLNDNRVINTGYRGEFRFSNDKGKTWYFPDSSRRKFIVLSMCQCGYLLASKRDVAGKLISKDKGKTWQKLISRFFDKNGNPVNSITDYSIGPIGDYLTSIQYDSLSQKRIIYVSTDCGETFYQKYEVEASMPNVSLIIAPDTLIKYSLASNQTADGDASELEFSYSFDGGKTVVSNRFPGLWNNLTFPIYGSYIAECYFLNGHTGYIVGTDGNILKTTNTGRSWRYIQSGVTETLRDITFIDANTGFIAGNFGRMLKTTDGGETWRRTNSGTQENIFAVTFRNRYEGWAGTSDGLIYTRDSGETWQGVPLRYQHGYISRISFDNAGNGYAYTTHFGESGSKFIKEIKPRNYTALLYLKNSENSVAATPAGENPVKSLALWPNYPNPFNRTTHIRFSLPENEQVSLKIYNIQGQLVRTLLDEVRQPGEHAVVWDGTGNAGQLVASGVYFLRLIQGEQVRLRKVLVLK